MKTQDFLLELGCEELPPKLLNQLSQTLALNLSAQLGAANLSYGEVSAFATPRRLAVWVQDLQTQQTEQNIERKGPKISASEQAIAGFAKSCGVTKEDLTQKSLAKADYYYFSQQQKGAKTTDLLADIVKTAIKQIPIVKPMRWGDGDFSFARPVHWIVMLLGSGVVDGLIMGLKSSNITRGMRWSGEGQFCIDSAQNYRKIMLEKADIEVDFEARKNIIRTQIMQIARDNNARAVIDEELLTEVCALVEVPFAFSGKFDAQFLTVPEEALISAMKLHQKYFHMVDKSGKLLPTFIAVANIKTSDIKAIIDGNERVISPRLSDTQFFWTQDKAVASTTRLDRLRDVLFMDGLGSVYDKSKRIEELSGYIAQQIDENIDTCRRAGLLCKNDLVSNMVGEFADLQGVMGGYYALNDKENPAVAKAISEHYFPRFSGDSLPSTAEGLVVATADKIDSIVGIVSIYHKPTGSKDPYALKRAGLGLLRIMIESKLELNLFDLVIKSAQLHQCENSSAEIYDFILSRLDAYYQEQNIDSSILKAVKHSTGAKNKAIYDWNLRIQALNSFMQNKNIQGLIEANKRIKNILKDIEVKGVLNQQFDNEFDGELYQAIERAQKALDKNQQDYQKTIQVFLDTTPVLNNFFDRVMINDEDLDVREQRLRLINAFRQVLLSVADFAYLSK